MFTLDTFVLVKCTYFIIWISDGHRGFGLRLFPLCFACFALLYLVRYYFRLVGYGCLWETGRSCEWSLDYGAVRVWQHSTASPAIYG